MIIAYKCMGNFSNSKDSSNRRKALMKLLSLIADGKFDSKKIPEDLIFILPNSPRAEYTSPLTRDSYNYGYMELDDMTATNPSVD